MLMIGRSLLNTVRTTCYIINNDTYCNIVTMTMNYSSTPNISIKIKVKTDKYLSQIYNYYCNCCEYL